MFKPTDAYLLGYYGQQNTGDDALLYASAWAARHYLGCKKLKVSVFGDKHSLELVKHLAPKANVKLTFDLAPALLCQKDITANTIPKRGIAFNFCQRAINAFGETNLREEQQRIDKACRLIEKVWEQTREPIYLVGFNGHPKFGDHLVHAQILTRLNTRVQVSQVPYFHNPLQLLQTLQRFKSLVCMRLHAAIFGYLTQTPTYILNYHEKCQNWSEQIGLSSRYVFDACEFDASEVANTLINGLEYGVDTPALPVKTAVEKSMLNWSENYDARTVFGSNTALQQS